MIEATVIFKDDLGNEVSVSVTYAQPCGLLLDSFDATERLVEQFKQDSFTSLEAKLLVLQQDSIDVKKKV